MGTRIRVAFVYGSVAKGSDTARSDVDLMVIAEHDLSYAEVFGALQEAEKAIGRSVNPNLLTAEEWSTRKKEESHFVDRVAAQPKVFIIGAEDDLG